MRREEENLKDDRARVLLVARLEWWAKRLNVRPRSVRVRSMTKKWGSCSTRGIVTLASELIDQDEAFRDVVIVHELLHLRIAKHGRLFKALMSAYVPTWREVGSAAALATCAANE